MRTLAEIVHLRGATCRDAADAIPQIAAGEDFGVDSGAAAHVAVCLRCQAEVAAYRRVLAHLRDLRLERLPFPSAVLAGTIAALEEAETAGAVPSWAVRAAYVGGLTAAGVLVWYGSRRRPGLLAHAG